MMKTLLTFIAENQALIFFGAAAILAVCMDHLWAYRRGWEACCRSFAARTIDETRRSHSERV